MENSKRFYLILHNIRSLHNLGAILRTAEGAGINKIFLTGYTPDPLDRFGKIRKQVAKTALGAEKSSAFEKFARIFRLIEKLKKEKIFIVALEQNPKAISYKKFVLRYRQKIKNKSGLALILGNEVQGLSQNILKKSDAIIEIPMSGNKESLNVSVAAGIALFKLRDLF